MSSRFPRLALCALFVATHAFAAEPPARDRAKALIDELEKQGAAKGAARDVLAEAKRALVRADRARSAGDQKHGTLLESLALEWAEAGRDLERTAKAETRAAELEKKLTDAEVKLRTTRTLIEQAAARRARADAELAELERNGAVPAPSATPPTAPAASGKPPAGKSPSAAPAKPAPSAAPTKPAPSAAPAKPKEAK